MNLNLIITLLVSGGIIINAQSDSSLDKKYPKDSNTVGLPNKMKLHIKDFVIQNKDLDLIRPADGMNYIVNGDTLIFSKEEIESGLTVAELKAIRTNRNTSFAYITPRIIDEEKEFPALFRFRNILGISKTIAVIIIILLSIF